MEIKEYLKIKKLTIDELAQKIGIARTSLNNIILKNRKPSSKLAKRIEEVTNGNVTRYSLLWPEEFK